MTQQCRECGAKLPDGSTACLQCGTPVHASSGSKGRSQAALEFVQPAISGGLLLGLLSSLPIISLGNAIFGMWILAGGALTANLLNKQRPSGISVGDGAFGGVLSGLFGSIVSTLMVIPSKLYFVSGWKEVHQGIEQQLNNTPEVPVPFRDLLLRATSPEVSFTTEMVWFFIYGFTYSLLAMVGGMLMAWILDRRKGKGIAA
jgi:hypothetical protein